MKKWEWIVLGLTCFAGTYLPEMTGLGRNMAMSMLGALLAGILFDCVRYGFTGEFL